MRTLKKPCFLSKIILAGAVISTACLLLISFPEVSKGRTRGIRVKAKTDDGSTREIHLYSGYHALVVGCSNYRKGWPMIPNAVKDSREVATALKRMGWTVDLLEDPDWFNLRRALNRLITGPGRERDKAIFFWFSGHGHTLKEAGGKMLGYIVPVDAPDPDRDEIGFMEHAISMRDIETVAKRIEARHALMMFDSCFSGAIFQAVRSRPTPFIEGKVQKDVRQFITAGAENEKVPDRSVFKVVFLQAISDGYADRNRDGYVTGLELGNYLQEQVVNYSRKAQNPQFGTINDPKLDKGDFVFLLSSSGAVVSRPGASSLSVECNVSGADVYLAGKKIGTTPLSDTPVPVGEHRVIVEGLGYESYSKQMRFERGRARDLYVILEPKAPSEGRLFVYTKPLEAKVRILNIGPKFQQGIELDPGKYHVEVSAVGHETQRMWVAISAGRDKTVDIKLKKVAGPGLGQKITNSVSMEFVYIKPASFMMGSPSNEPGRDSDEVQHRVKLTKGFYMQKTEVTQGQWKAVMRNNPSNFKNCGDSCPVEKVSWNDVQEFITKLNRRGEGRYRLPTEAEWEYACRAGSTNRFYFGDDEGRLGEYAWYGKNSSSRSHPVARKKPNAWGLYDMHGNVWEWCQDWYGDYPAGSIADPGGPDGGSGRVLRGGSWGHIPRDVRCANRRLGTPARRFRYIGFRLVRTD